MSRRRIASSASIKPKRLDGLYAKGPSEWKAPPGLN